MNEYNRWHSFIPADKEQNRSIWCQEHTLRILCRDLGPEYKLEKAETLPGIDPEYVMHRELDDGYDIEIMTHGNYRHKHYLVSLWGKDGTECIKTVGDLFYGEIPECVDGLIQTYVPKSQGACTGFVEEPYTMKPRSCYRSA